MSLTARIFAVSLLVISVRDARAIEPWADKALPVKDSVALWLDAGAEEQALAADGLKPNKGAVTPGLWHDGSGNKRHARQADAGAHPPRNIAYPMWKFGFDGQRQFFAVEAEGWTMREATVLVFARAGSNAGGFRGLVSARAAGGNDYATGFNLDLGAKASSDGLTTLNAEGAGFRGERNLLGAAVPFGKTFSAAMVIGAEQVAVFRDGKAQGTRARAAGTALSAAQLLIGARTYDNAGGPPTARGFFHGDIFEVLVYERALSESEVRAVSGYFAAKYAGVVHIAAAKVEKVAGSVPLVAVKDPPVIQPLVPGFTARKLPVQLSNINFLRYRADGRLYAGAYDGKVWLLRDTDGDGLEDQADIFYDGEDLKVVMGLAVTPPGYARGEGVFVATRGRILLILDRDHDGRGDEVVTVAKDWEKAKVLGGGVSDALGLALGKDGSVYFTLATHDFTNAYLLDAATGKAGYHLGTERGTVQRVSPDFSKRETVCTGLRVNVGLGFNAAGDLFATEQEGATWLANGNPFDELLHIEKGRHYGFPPRHPQHLPDVVDEPSTFDFGPQHQSAVGLCFDEPVGEGGPIFGPAWWRGDALVAAMSRGKIYRTKMVKTAAGYVAKNETFAQLQRIVIDQAVSPRGALAVTLHGGAPDWGTGPTGAGELWQIQSSSRLQPVNAPEVVKANASPDARADELKLGTTFPPQPVMVWSASSTELRVAFDEPISVAALAAMQGKVRVTQGRYVQAGDRFETMRPGYQVVKNQLVAPRFQVTVQSLALADEARTLVVTTPARTAAVGYAISIEADVFKVGGAAPFAGQIDLLADLTGLEAEFSGNAGTVKTWLPHPDFAVSRELTAASSATRAFFASLANQGTITLRGQLDLGQMLSPAVQEGSKLDWEYPAEQVTVVCTAARPFSFTLGNKSGASQPKDGRHEAAHTVTTRGGDWLPLALDFSESTGDPALAAHWFTGRSATPRAFPLRRVLLPYAKQQEAPPMPHNEDLPQLAGAKWQNGKPLFQGLCAVCHAMRGEGGRVGPDLTNLIYRDYDSVLRDIREPNAAINPEHVAYTVTKRNSEEITAVLIAENANSVSLAQVGGQVLEVPRAEIAGMQQLATSLMPAGLDQALPADQLRDLMSYLLLPPFEPAPLMIPGAPPPRKMSEVRAILGDKATTPMDPNAKPLRIVLCASEKDKAHAKPGYHDYPLWRSRWARLLRLAPGITVETANDWPSAEQWRTADVIAINSHNPTWSDERDPAKVAALAQQMDAFLARGGGFVSIHWSVNAGPHTDALAERLGLAWAKGGRYRHGATDWVLDKNHPIAAGFTDFIIPDESYWHLGGNLTAAQAQVLATSLEEATPRPQMWTREVGAGRVFVSIPGHFTWTHDDPLYRILILRGMMWTAKQPLDRLAPLSVIGARVEK